MGKRDYCLGVGRDGLMGGEGILENGVKELGGMMGEEKELMEEGEGFYEEVV